MTWSIVSIIVSFLAFAVAFWMYQWVSKLPTTNKEIARVGALIRNGAKTFLVREYRSDRKSVV